MELMTSTSHISATIPTSSVSPSADRRAASDLRVWVGVRVAVIHPKDGRWRR
jgi:hypothetical protein